MFEIKIDNERTDYYYENNFSRSNDVVRKKYDYIKPDKKETLPIDIILLLAFVFFFIFIVLFLIFIL